MKKTSGRNKPKNRLPDNSYGEIEILDFFGREMEALCSRYAKACVDRVKRVQKDPLPASWIKQVRQHSSDAKLSYISSENLRPLLENYIKQAIEQIKKLSLLEEEYAKKLDYFTVKQDSFVLGGTKYSLIEAIVQVCEEIQTLSTSQSTMKSEIVQENLILLIKVFNAYLSYDAFSGLHNIVCRQKAKYEQALLTIKKIKTDAAESNEIDTTTLHNDLRTLYIEGEEIGFDLRKNRQKNDPLYKDNDVNESDDDAEEPKDREDEDDAAEESEEERLDENSHLLYSKIEVEHPIGKRKRITKKQEELVSEEKLGETDPDIEGQTLTLGLFETTFRNFIAGYGEMTEAELLKLQKRCDSIAQIVRNALPISDGQRIFSALLATHDIIYELFVDEKDSNKIFTFLSALIGLMNHYSKLEDAVSKKDTREKISFCAGVMVKEAATEFKSFTTKIDGFFTDYEVANDRFLCFEIDELKKVEVVALSLETGKFTEVQSQLESFRVMTVFDGFPYELANLLICLNEYHYWFLETNELSKSPIENKYHRPDVIKIVVQELSETTDAELQKIARRISALLTRGIDADGLLSNGLSPPVANSIRVQKRKINAYVTREITAGTLVDGDIFYLFYLYEALSVILSIYTMKDFPECLFDITLPGQVLTASVFFDFLSPRTKQFFEDKFQQHLLQPRFNCSFCIYETIAYETVSLDMLKKNCGKLLYDFDCLFYDWNPEPGSSALARPDFDVNVAFAYSTWLTWQYIMNGIARFSFNMGDAKTIKSNIQPPSYVAQRFKRNFDRFNRLMNENTDVSIKGISWGQRLLLKNEYSEKLPDVFESYDFLFSPGKLKYTATEADNQPNVAVFEKKKRLLTDLYPNIIQFNLMVDFRKAIKGDVGFVVTVSPLYPLELGEKAAIEGVIKSFCNGLYELYGAQRSETPDVQFVEDTMEENEDEKPRHLDKKMKDPDEDKDDISVDKEDADEIAVVEVEDFDDLLRIDFEQAIMELPTQLSLWYVRQGISIYRDENKGKDISTLDSLLSMMDWNESAFQEKLYELMCELEC